MKTPQKLFLAAGLAAALALSACGGNDDPGPVVAPVPPPPVVVVPPPVVVATVPDSAGISVSAFISYLLSLSSGDETSEPAIIKDLFAVPLDETSEPQQLS